MKMLIALMLLIEICSIPAFAVGRDQASPDCKKVIADIQEQLKRTRPASEPSAPASAPAAAPSSSAQ